MSERRPDPARVADDDPVGSRRTVAVNAAWLMVERVVGMAAAAGVAVALARALGPASFGLYSASLSVALIISDLAGLGFGVLIGHELLSRPTAEHQRIIGSAVRLRLLAATLAAVVCIAVIELLVLDGRGRWPMVLALAGVPAVRALEVHEYAHQAFERGRTLALTRVASSVLVGLGVVAFLVSGARSLGGAALIDLSRYLLYVAVLAALVNRSVGRSRWDGAEARYLLRKAAPLTLPVIAFAINMRIDQVMLGVMADPSEAGVYAASARVGEVAYFLPVVLMTALLPRLMRVRHDPPAYDRGLVRACAVMWVLGTAVMVAYLLLADLVIPTLYGREFAEGATVLRIVSLALPFVFLRGVFGRWIVIEERLDLAVVTTGSSAVVNVALNLFLIPAFGARGAALATVAAYVVSGYLILYLIPSTRPAVGHMNRGLLAVPAVVREGVGLVVGSLRR